MESSGTNSYLETEVLTATPQRLRLMLIQGALRFARQTLVYWEQGEADDAYEAATRCRGIVTELLITVKPSGEQVNRQVASVYLYLFRTLTDALREQNADRLRDVIRVLDVEAETWNEVCQKFPHALTPDEVEEVQEITAGELQAIPPSDQSPARNLTGFDSARLLSGLGESSSPLGHPHTGASNAGFDSASSHASPPATGGMSFEA